jgi:hypothetical protein
MLEKGTVNSEKGKIGRDWSFHATLNDAEEAAGIYIGKLTLRSLEG